MAIPYWKASASAFEKGFNKNSKNTKQPNNHRPPLSNPDHRQPPQQSLPSITPPPTNSQAREEFTIDMEDNKEGKRSEDGWKVVEGRIAERLIRRGVVTTILKNLWPEAEAPIIGEIRQNLFSITQSAKLLYEAVVENP
ncbi:hypothetical protein CCACVL1_20040 [Corchorus capsularis]|uniref:Uncharacterized protein n=1 Tax=Corchorus capsularis TaxID=210143 RepID=A0A1R3HCY5_COCAP|nr:hypothetical protein CCACVL1_20040 [Corchorus capsularis]